jgi:hypothetical protein
MSLMRWTPRGVRLLRRSCNDSRNLVQEAERLI